LERLSKDQFLKAFNAAVPASPEVALPVVTFNDSITLHVNNEALHIFHVSNAHTDGDSVVHFRSSNVIHTGDIFFNGFYPFIDTDHGGSLDGMIAATQTVAALATADTIIIPGHGPLADKSALENYIAMLTTVRDRINNLRKKGKSCEEIIAASPLADLNDRWGGGLFSEAAFLAIVCND
jgi:glyoxylase-like metal-dependent hydrolase (beta-lactamase superfamily II)